MRREQNIYETIAKKLQMQQSVREWLDNIPFNVFLTANFNCKTTEHSARSALRRWHGHIDRKLLGPKWHKKPLGRRTLFVAFVEHPFSNRHFHIKLRTNEPMLFAMIAEQKWKRIVPGGSMDVQFVDHAPDNEATTGYSSKNLWQYDAMETFVISTEFSTRT